MKLFFVIVSVVWAVIAIGQTSDKPIHVLVPANKISANDTTLKVVYADKESTLKKPAYFLNGKLASETVMATLNPMQIESINVINNNVEIDSIQYHGQVFVKTKNSYKPKLISLTELKNNYTDLKNKSTLFMIDGTIINADYDKYLVDENNLLTVVVDHIENAKEKIDMGLIKLLTRSEENIKKSKEIRIRGTETALGK